jgi:hypothetical protein
VNDKTTTIEGTVGDILKLQTKTILKILFSKIDDKFQENNISLNSVGMMAILEKGDIISMDAEIEEYGFEAKRVGASKYHQGRKDKELTVIKVYRVKHYDEMGNMLSEITDSQYREDEGRMRLEKLSSSVPEMVFDPEGISVPEEEEGEKVDETSGQK